MSGPDVGPPAGSAGRAAGEEAEVPRLGPGRKSAYALGDFTVNTVLAGLSLVYTSYFLTQVADLRPVYAGLVPLIGRVVDAVSDPLMGRISDRTRWRWGRRRPYLLLAAAPFGATFALLWSNPPFDAEFSRFLYYTAVYCALSLAMTMVSVPYLALQPEMAVDYDERTSLNTYRTVGSLLGVFAAVSVEPVAAWLGGGAEGFRRAGLGYGLLMALPWLAVYWASFERPSFRTRIESARFGASVRTALASASFRRLTGIYLTGRIAMDLIGALLILYVTFWLGRRGDFAPMMMFFVLSVVVALPFWLHVSRNRDKASVFVFGSLWWMVSTFFMGLAQPEWPRWIMFVYLPLVAVGYAVVDLMPWSMLGEVVDEDELHTGERREGIYNGLFMFLRKLGGALGVFLVMGLLDIAGLTKGETQTESVRQTIRWMTALAPGVFLALAVWLAHDYPLTRERHAEIVRALGERRAAAPEGAADTPGPPA